MQKFLGMDFAAGEPLHTPFEVLTAKGSQMGGGIIPSTTGVALSIDIPEAGTRLEVTLYLADGGVCAALRHVDRRQKGRDVLWYNKASKLTLFDGRVDTPGVHAGLINWVKVLMRRYLYSSEHTLTPSTPDSPFYMSEVGADEDE